MASHWSNSDLHKHDRGETCSGLHVSPCCCLDTSLAVVWVRSGIPSVSPGDRKETEYNTKAIISPKE